MTSKRQTHPRSFSRTSMLGWDATHLGTYNPDPWMALPEQFSERQPKLFKHSFPPPTAKCTNTMSRNCATTTQNGSGLLAPAKEWKTFASGSCNASRTARVHISSNSYNDFPLSPCHYRMNVHIQNGSNHKIQQMQTQLRRRECMHDDHYIKQQKETSGSKSLVDSNIKFPILLKKTLESKCVDICFCIAVTSCF